MNRKIESLVAAISTLDENDEANWLASGKPDVGALNKLVDFDVSAAERDHAWDEFQKQNPPTPSPDSTPEDSKDADPEEGSSGDADDENANDAPEAGTDEDDKDTEDTAEPAAGGPAGGGAYDGTYEVISPLQHNGERYEVGADISLYADEAEPLLGHTVKPKKQ